MLGRIVTSLFLIISILVSAPIKEDQRSISMIHSNDLNLLGETSGGGTGDDMLTGTLDINYRSSKAYYEMSLKSYTQKYLVDGERIDTLSLGYLRDLVSRRYIKYEYNIIIGVQLKDSENFGGETLQNSIHKLTENFHHDLPYSTKKHTTLGLEGRMWGLYEINQNLNLYNNLLIEANIDKSGSVKLELGVEGIYSNLSFWLGGVTQYIEPFKHTIVEFSTPDKYSAYAVLGASVIFSKKYELMLETTFGGAPLGEEDDYSTLIRLRYFLD